MEQYLKNRETQLQKDLQEHKNQLTKLKEAIGREEIIINRVEGALLEIRSYFAHQEQMEKAEKEQKKDKEKK